MNTVRKLFTAVLVVTGAICLCEQPKTIDKEDLLALKMQVKIPSAQLAESSTSFFAASNNPLSEEQVKKVSKLDLEIVRINNALKELKSGATDRVRRQQLHEQLVTLQQQKALENKKVFFSNQLGGLETALDANSELLKSIGDQLQKLKNFETEENEKIRDILEKQERKLMDFRKRLEEKKNQVKLQIAGINR